MAFRMSSIQFMANYQSSLNRTYRQQAKFLEKGDGSSIHRGSDDPIAYSKLIRYKVNANENEQYKADVNTAQAWMQTTDGAITHIADITKTFKEKVVAAANSYHDENDFDAIAKEIYALIEETVATGNVQHGDRYIFAGQQDQTQPFKLSDEIELRAATRTLDQAQTTFFTGKISTDPSKLTQFVAVQDSDGNDYFMDTTRGLIYNRGLVDSDYLDKNYTGKDYEDLIAKGYKTIDDILNSVPADDLASYGIYDISQSMHTDTAVTYLADLLKSDDISSSSIDSDTAVKNLNKSLGDTLTRVVYGLGGTTDTAVIQSLANLSSYANSDTVITNAMSAAGITDPTTQTAITTAIKNFLSDNESTLDSYKVSASYYFDNKGVLAGNKDVELYINGEWQTFTFQTEKQNMVYYFGDMNNISMVKTNGATDTAADIVNAVGKDLFGTDMFDNDTSGRGYVPSGAAMINDMITVYNHIKAGDVNWLQHDGILIADAVNTTVINSQTTIGARLQLYNESEVMLDNMSDNITEQITDVSGTDVAKLATDLMEMTTLYNMALALGGRVLPQSLADYL